MNVSTTGASSLSALYLQQLLGSSSSTALADLTGTDTSGTTRTDSVTLSEAALQAAASQSTSSTASTGASQGSDPFQTDLATLESQISSGDITSAKSTYASMVEKMKQHGDVPSDFAALGKALDSGDTSAITAAMDTVKTNVANHQPPPGGGLGNADDSDAGSTSSTDSTTLASLLVSLQASQTDGTAASTSSTSAKSLESLMVAAYTSLSGSGS